MFVVAATVAVVGGGLFATPASAGYGLYVWPNKAPAGSVVKAGGSCPEGGGENTVASTGFVAPIPLNSTGRVINKPGHYTAYLICRRFGLDAQFEIVAGPSLSVQPKEVQPGGPVKLQVRCPGGASPVRATSPGFDADIAIALDADGVGGATAKAVNKPGSYSVALRCADTSLTASFKVLAPSATPTPSSTKPAPPQVVVKPKAAPETGGGFLVGSR
jgi:hypothetical protein